MSESKFTPGPWYAWDNGDGLIGVGKNHGNQADLFRAASESNRPKSEDDANMKLAASAPDMIAMLERTALQFRYYEEAHREKGTADSMRKAEVNAGLAYDIEQVIAKATA